MADNGAASVQLQATRRSPLQRSILRFVAATIVLGGLTSYAGCAKHACNDDTLARALETASKTPSTQRTELMSQALLEACTSADEGMPPLLRTALVAVREYERGPAAIKVIEAIRADSGAWTEACSAGTAAFDSLGGDLGRASLAIARACNAERFGWASEGDFMRSHPTGVMVAILAWPWLSAKGAAKVRAHHVVEALLAAE